MNDITHINEAHRSGPWGIQAEFAVAEPVFALLASAGRRACHSCSRRQCISAKANKIMKRDDAALEATGESFDSCTKLHGGSHES